MNQTPPSQPPSHHLVPQSLSPSLPYYFRPEKKGEGGEWRGGDGVDEREERGGEEGGGDEGEGDNACNEAEVAVISCKVDSSLVGGRGEGRKGKDGG